ncbi:hypothetical protein QAD02_016712 [Eretmocerus hayati]|uniref:Uncharacterized protein n=1 Tax=Eretmocerus hayati TaxID=131215 RepID=A0ACC2PGN4_9HYME|nr:hypothetical protein QAD02_016712 [Eretmocerus hayati]
MAKTVEIEVVESSVPSSVSKHRSPEKCASGRVLEESPASYKPLLKDPLSKHRVATDWIFNHLFLILLVIWLGVCFFGRYRMIEIRQPSNQNKYSRTHDYWSSNRQSASYPSYSDTSYKSVRPVDDLIDYVYEFHYNGGLFFLIASLFSTGMLILGSLRILCKYPKQFATVGYNFVLLSMVISILIFIVVTVAAAVEEPAIILLTVPCSVMMLINFSVISSIRSIGVDSIAIFIKKTCQALLHCRFLILYALSILLSHLLIASFTYVIMISLSKVIPTTIAFFGGLYVCLCIWYLNQMVVAGVLATWHSKQSEPCTAKNVLWPYVKTIGRFHFGSAALQATYIIPLCLSILACVKSKIENVSFKACIATWICKLDMIFNIADCTSIETAVNGLDFFRAARRVHNLVAKHSFLYLGLVATVHVICFCTSIAIGLVSFILCKVFFFIVYPQIFDESNRDYRIQVAVIAEMVLLLTTAWLIMGTAIQTTLLCSLESNEIEKIDDKLGCQMKEFDAEASAPPLAAVQE